MKNQLLRLIWQLKYSAFNLAWSHLLLDSIVLMLLFICLAPIRLIECWTAWECQNLPISGIYKSTLIKLWLKAVFVSKVNAEVKAVYVFREIHNVIQNFVQNVFLQNIQQMAFLVKIELSLYQKDPIWRLEILDTANLLVFSPWIQLKRTKLSPGWADKSWQKDRDKYGPSSFPKTENQHFPSKKTLKNLIIQTNLASFVKFPLRWPI